MRLYLFLLSTLIIHLVTVNCNISVNFSTENTSETINNIPRGSFTNNFTEYELVHPQKVSSKGEFLSSYLPHFHESTKDRKRREKETESLHYHIPINGKRVQVELKPNENVFPPNMVIEHRCIHSDEDIGNIRLRTPEKRNCFYKGKLTHDPNSKVALSTCNGLAGYIRSQKEGEYLIEPIQDYDPHNEDHPHIIFRKKYDTSKSKNGCGVKVKHKTMKQKEISKTQNSLFNKQLFQPPSSKSKDKRIEMSSFPEHDKNKDNSSATNEKSDDYIYSDSEYTTESEREIKIKPRKGETKGSIKCKGKGCTNGKHYDQVIKNNKMFKEYTNTSMSNQDILLADCKPSPDKCNKNNIANTANTASKPPDDKKENVKKAQRKKTDRKKCFSNKNRTKGKNELDTEDKELYKSKDISKSDKLDSSFHGKKILSKNMLDHYSDWDHVVKSMLQNDKIENLKSSNQNLNTDYLDSSLKHHHKGNAKQKIKSVPEQEDEETNISSKIKKDLRKNMIIDYNVNNPTNQNLNVHKNYNSYNNAKKREVILSNETDSSGKPSYESRIIRSLYVSNDVQVNNTNGETKFKRAIALQYKSCKPLPCCRNRTECTHDLRLLVVISYIFSQNHKDIDLETYVLTLLNMISINFHDATLGILVNIKLVRMVFIEYKMEELDEEKNSFEQLFENFCVFQYRINPHRADHPNRHDIAVYIINVNQCGGNRFIGITNKESICHSKDTCILSVDDGLLLANIITHQLGHSLGAEHDDGGQGSCQPFEPDGSIYYFMGPQITQNATEWSVCSSQAIIRFIRNQGDRCLKFFAVELDFEFPSILPGQIYSPTQQCSLNFRMKTLPCYTGDFCKYLYCQASKYECVSRLVPPADGTLCATGMWCIRGNCVSKGRYPGSVNGEWSNWSEWTMCSRSCGGGIQHSKRMCNNPPPALGGRYCVGERIRHQMCNYHTRCDRFSGSYHDYQCTKTEFMPFRGQFYTWRSYHNSFENVACNLICESNTGIIAVRELVAHDGTPCKPGTKNVCVQGKCTEIGCDWGVNSRAYRDACGNCQGNGTECRIIQGIFEDKGGKGTVPFLKIPKGSGMIYAREINPSDALLVVSGYDGETYYLNGPAQLLEPKPAEYNFGGGTRGVYSMRGEMERIYIPGPLEEDLIFHLKLHNDPNPGIRYQFAVPEVDKNYIPSYTWMFLDWEYCSDACGGGQQRASAKCVEDQGGRVDDKYCLERERPDDVIRSCNEFPCIPKWWVGAWSDCVPIGNEEIRYRSVLCMRTRDAISLRNEILKDKFCCEEEKPDSIRRCNETVDDKPFPMCDYSKGCQGPPSIYNIQDLDPTFSDLIDSKIREANIEEIARNYFKDRLSENDEEDPYDLDVDLSALNDLGGTKIISADKKRETKNRTKETPIFRNETHQNSNLVKDEVNSEVDENTKKKHNKKNYGKMYLQQNILSHERKTVSKNGTDKYKKLSALGGGSAYANQGSGRHRVNLQHKNLLVKTSIDKPQLLANNYNKFGGTNCPCSQCPTTLPPPLCIPPETTCTTRCTTCPPMLKFTIPNSNYLVFRPACPVIDQIVLSDFKISIIPIICDQGYDMQNDFYFQIYHETGSWPFGLENNRTIIRGQRALFYLLEIRNNVTKAPFIYHGEN